MSITRIGENLDVEVHLRRSRRAKRMTLRVSSRDGRVTLTVPTHVSVAEALGFVEERRDWIEEARAQACEPVSIGQGATLPVAGAEVTIEIAKVRSPRLENQVLKVPARAPGRAVAAYLKLRARDALTASADRYSDAIETEYAAITLRDPRSRWGSCSTERRLMFSWRLAMAPWEVLDYVAAHEVAHLRHMDHSPAFWTLVEDLCPDWRLQRDWLKQKGNALHAYRFED